MLEYWTARVPKNSLATTEWNSAPVVPLRRLVEDGREDAVPRGAEVLVGRDVREAAGALHLRPEP